VVGSTHSTALNPTRFSLIRFQCTQTLDLHLSS
jgi:hypothetical protein